MEGGEVGREGKREGGRERGREGGTEYHREEKEIKGGRENPRVMKTQSKQTMFNTHTHQTHTNGYACLMHWSFNVF